MSGPAFLDPDEILATLRELRDGVSAPLWLFGGVAVDFMVGRWTRPHGDVDLNAWAADRTAIARDLARLGYETLDSGWLTHWRQRAAGRMVEIVFLQQNQDGEAELVIEPGAPIGTPGRHGTVRGYLSPDRWAELGGVRFRVCHPLGEWHARISGSGVVPGRPDDPKLAHDRGLLETIIPEQQREAMLAEPNRSPTIRRTV